MATEATLALTENVRTNVSRNLIVSHHVLTRPPRQHWIGNPVVKSVQVKYAPRKCTINRGISRMLLNFHVNKTLDISYGTMTKNNSTMASRTNQIALRAKTNILKNGEMIPITRTFKCHYAQKNTTQGIYYKHQKYESSLLQCETWKLSSSRTSLSHRYRISLILIQKDRKNVIWTSRVQYTPIRYLFDCYEKEDYNIYKIKVHPLHPIESNRYRASWDKLYTSDRHFYRGQVYVSIQKQPVRENRADCQKVSSYYNCTTDFEISQRCGNEIEVCVTMKYYPRSYSRRSPFTTTSCTMTKTSQCKPSFSSMKLQDALTDKSMSFSQTNGNDSLSKSAVDSEKNNTSAVIPVALASSIFVVLLFFAIICCKHKKKIYKHFVDVKMRLTCATYEHDMIKYNNYITPTAVYCEIKNACYLSPTSGPPSKDDSVTSFYDVTYVSNESPIYEEIPYDTKQ